MMADDVAPSERPVKIIAGADSLGAALKDSVVKHLRSLNIEVVDLPMDSYYSIGQQIGRLVSSSSPPGTTRGIVACGTGVGVSIFANKFPGVYAATCLTPGDAANARSITGCNVLALSGMATSADSAAEIVDAWLDTPFKAPCPASGSVPWPEDIRSFLDASVREISAIGSEQQLADNCAVCSLTGNRDFTPIEVMPGGSMKILRETPTSAIVRFKAGSVEPAHHHTFGHDLVVLKGIKSVWNLTKKEKHDLGVGDYLFTPAGDVHRVKYFEDTEFFIKWDGHWDLLMDEDLDTANAAINKEVI